MIINKNSWHYRLLDHFDHEVVSDLMYGHNVTLCGYFWSVFGALWKALCVSIGIALMILASCVSLYGLFCVMMFLLIPFTGTILDYKTYEVGLIVLVPLIVAATILGVLATLSGAMKVVPNWLRSNKPKPVKKQPSLLWSWIKAKKDKVCPLVKLEEK